MNPGSARFGLPLACAYSVRWEVHHWHHYQAQPKFDCHLVAEESFTDIHTWDSDTLDFS